MFTFPYIYKKYDTNQIMIYVIIAMFPGILVKSYYDHFSTLIQLTISLVSVSILEILILKLKKKKIKNILQDFSFIITGILIGISIPSFSSWWINVLGIFFSIVFAKEIYGGLGKNIFNPAMVGYAMLLISFPDFMSYSIIPYKYISEDIHFSNIISSIFSNDSIDFWKRFEQSIGKIDFVTQPTPLNYLKTYGNQDQSFFLDYLIKKNKYCFLNFLISKKINIAFFLGGLFLIYKKIINWRIPFSFLITITMISGINWFFFQEKLISPYVHLFSGSTMLGAFFVATDPVTTCCTNFGKIVFGVIIGLLEWMIRTFGGYSDAIAFSVLIANMLVPLLEHYVRCNVYGVKND
ncbi:RnfABCDGE type electron transport complex subunit D [Buchnera aphidicola (Mindarus keteleerifoliae)]|uniref:RnfABCDGE type electron transport complex subunit D n=1 Tax=Buchnera aphidicola TaxID=9 RepID=UPI0031B6BA3D